MIQPFYQPQPMGSMMPVGGSAAATQVVGGFSGPFVGQQQQDNGNGFQKRFNRGGFQGGNYGQGGHHRGGYAGNIGSGGYQGGHQGGPQRTGGPSKNDVQKYKTQICRHFDQHGTCTLGDSCVFAHGPSELRNLSDVSILLRTNNTISLSLLRFSLNFKSKPHPLLLLTILHSSHRKLNH